MSTYIKFTDDNSESLTHYGVKGMRLRYHKRQQTDLRSGIDGVHEQVFDVGSQTINNAANNRERLDRATKNAIPASPLRSAIWQEMKNAEYKRVIKNRQQESSLKARPSLAPALKYNSERAKKTIDRLFSKAKKGLTKTINKKRSIDIGRHHLEYGRMNSRDASGRKNTRYIQYRRGGKPKYFRAF